MSNPSVAHLVVDALRAAQIETLFCLPGVQNDDFFNVLVDARDITPVVTRHEQGASLMASGAAQVTGRPSACCVVPGPGLLNASAGLNTAYWGYGRVLAIAGQIPTGLQGRNVGTLHDMPDQHAIMQQVTKHAVQVHDPLAAVGQIQAAVNALVSGVPRPVGIEVPVNVWSMPVEESVETAVTSEQSVDNAAVERAAAVLAAAERPMIVVGSGAYGASAEVLELVELLQAAVTTRRQGHGVVPTAHELFVPITAAHRMWPEVDVVVGVGTRMEWPLGGWGWDDDLTLIQINIDPEEVDRHGITEVAINADAAAACRALVDALGPLDRPSRSSELAEQRAWFDQATAHLIPQRSYTAALRSVIPDDGAMVEDVTQIGFAAHLFYDHLAPRTFLTSGAAGNLGAGTAMAIGASYASDAPVVGVIGDGGFLFTATELATAAQFDIPCNLVVFNNGAYGNVRRIQQERFGPDRTIASTLQNPDFQQFGQSFGLRTWSTDSPDTMAAALAECIAHDGPGLVEVTVDPMPNPWPFLRMPQQRANLATGQ